MIWRNKRQKWGRRMASWMETNTRTEIWILYQVTSYLNIDVVLIFYPHIIWCVNWFIVDHCISVNKLITQIRLISEAISKIQHELYYVSVIGCLYAKYIYRTLHLTPINYSPWAQRGHHAPPPPPRILHEWYHFVQWTPLINNRDVNAI